MEPSTSTGAGIALAKYVGIQTVVSLTAVILGFMVLRPKSPGEALVRIVCTVIASFVFGPLLVAVVHSFWPGIFQSALEVSQMDGSNTGILYVTAPLQIIAGLPAWWVIGAYVRWFDKRDDKDIGGLINDARESFPLPSLFKNKKKQDSDGQ